MSNLDGRYDVVAQTPMGNQNMTLTITVDGDTFTGSSSGAMGSSDISGSVEGSTLTWKQPITVPMPLTLDCTATVSGDQVTGTVDTGTFGAFPISGSKVG